MTKNPYEVLGLKDYCPIAEVKSAYRKLSMNCHPDLHGASTDNVKNFEIITQAYNEIKMSSHKINEILGLPISCTVDEVDSAYRSKMEILSVPKENEKENQRNKEHLKNMKHYYNLYKASFLATTKEDW